MSFHGASFSHESASEDDCSPQVLYEKSQYLLKRDQSLRIQYELKGNDPDFQKELRSQDGENQQILDKIVGKCGWPDSGDFYNSLLEAAFLIVLHAPHNYQEKYDDHLMKSYLQGKIPKSIYMLYESRFKYTENNFRK
jgi:hypothetical protein